MTDQKNEPEQVPFFLLLNRKKEAIGNLAKKVIKYMKTWIGFLFGPLRYLKLMKQLAFAPPYKIVRKNPHGKKVNKECKIE
jgi:hypothetical protein